MDITLTDDEAKQVKSTISNFKAQQGGKKAGDKLLKKYGVDDDIMETIISASTYSKQIMDQLDVAEPTDDEVKQYFVDNYLRAKHILISTKDMTTGADLDEDKLAEAEKKANEILERANTSLQTAKWFLNLKMRQSQSSRAKSQCVNQITVITS